MPDIEAAVREAAGHVMAKAAEIEASADAKEEGVEPGPFGIAVAMADGRLFSAGDVSTRFPIQSIGKVFALDLALEKLGDDVFDRVGREPSGDPFNSILDLEHNDGIPRNPFINAGALVVVDLLVEHCGDDRAASAVVDLIRHQLGCDTLPMDEDVIASEHEAGDLNQAMLSFMRHHGNLHSDPDDVMEAYVHQCAISLDCCGLAQAGRYLACTARYPDDEAADQAARRHRRLLALMTTCGNYDGSGDFAWRIGLPAKSGVGGGILAVVPGVASIGVWSPNLDQHGNSMQGVRGLEILADRLDWSIFGAPTA